MPPPESSGRQLSRTGTLGFRKNAPGKVPFIAFYHSLNIYRHQVIKQADVLLAMFLFGNEFSLEAKRRNFEFYDPLTTGDSSLSSCIEAIVAQEISEYDKAVKYARAALLDLVDRRWKRQRRLPYRFDGRYMDGLCLRLRGLARLSR
jgi:alpha,alpha-trehalose phosphorylase